MRKRSCELLRPHPGPSYTEAGENQPSRMACRTVTWPALIVVAVVVAGSVVAVVVAGSVVATTGPSSPPRVGGRTRPLAFFEDNGAADAWLRATTTDHDSDGQQHSGRRCKSGDHQTPHAAYRRARRGNVDEYWMRSLSFGSHRAAMHLCSDSLPLPN